MNLYIDFETWSSVHIRRGTDVYMDNARPLLMTYAVDDGPVGVYDFTAHDCMADMKFIDERYAAVIAHNAYFDRMVAERLLGIKLPASKWYCTNAQALSHGLPGGLGPLCKVLGVPADKEKDEDGKRLIRKFCGPKPFKKDDEWQKFIEYAVLDIEAMRACHKRMPNWNYKGNEKLLWDVDQRINNRGFAVDVTLAEEAIKALKANKGELDAETFELTSGEILAATQRDKMLQYLCEKQGCLLRDMTAPTIQEALEDESLDETTRSLLRIRLQASKSSTSKFRRLIECVGKDGRLRGTLQFAGASRTARWAGRIFQPQNLPRPTLRPEYIAQCVDMIRRGYGTMTAIFAPVPEACSNVLRGLIVAEDGNTLQVADYSAIEGRGLAWSAGEQWKLEAFRKKSDLYCLIYEKGFGLPAGTVTKKDPRRQIGKVMELALGYGGGVGAFINMAGTYNMDLDELGRTVEPDPKAIINYERAIDDGTDFGLPRNVYMACDTLKIGYRRANPDIVSFWYMLENAARESIAYPGTQHQVGVYVFDCNGQWMRIKLPSGRFLCYCLPKLGKNGEISYMSWRNKHWSRTKTYGGKLAENVVQAISRDMLAEGILRLEANGFPVVLHVHDEIVAEVPKGTRRLEDFIKLMATVPSWAPGFPLAAEGFEGERYEK